MSTSPSAPGEPEAALRALAARLRAEGSVISPHVVDSEEPPALGRLAAGGPRSASNPSAYAEVVELVREGYLLHHGRPRLVEPPDEDLALLAGDYLYALGLEELAALGDLEAVRELSDLISLVSQVHAPGEAPGRTADRAGALWLGCATAIGVGGGAGYRAAKERMRTGDDAQALYQTTAELAAGAGLGERLSAAAEAIGFSPANLG